MMVNNQVRGDRGWRLGGRGASVGVESVVPRMDRGGDHAWWSTTRRVDERVANDGDTAGRGVRWRGKNQSVGCWGR